MAKRPNPIWTKTAKAKAKWRRTQKRSRDRRIALILESLREGATIKAACQGARMNTRRYYEWLDAYPDFRDATEAAMASRLSIMVDALYQTGKEGNTTAIAMWLKGRDEHWRKALCMSYVGGTGPDGAVPLKVDGLAGMFKAALAKEKDSEEDAGGQGNKGRPGQTVHLPPAEGGPAGKV